jgi:hypothetical protein
MLTEDYLNPEKSEIKNFKKKEKNMSESKFNRTKKKQLGQFMTPITLSKSLIEKRQYKITDKILEPSFGEGSFLISIIEKLLNLYEDMTIQEKMDNIFSNNLYGVEMDKELYEIAIQNIENKFNCKIKTNNLINDDFFNVNFDFKFNYCEGNPPFGGTFETKFGEKLDKVYGKRNGEKIKKETYSFFTVKCIELLEKNGLIGFVCSDTFLSINTMKGLRKYVSNHTVDIKKISYFSEETNYGMVYFNVKVNNEAKLIIDGNVIDLEKVNMTPNYSFLIDSNYGKYFEGKLLKDFIRCSSGMTVGKNELFLKDVVNGNIIEQYNYKIVSEVKTVEKEIKRNKLGKLTDSKKTEIQNGVLEKVLKIEYLENPKLINLPNDDYKPYNKSTSDEIFSQPKTFIYWKNNGEAVIRFKKTGPWYLHGVGGQKFFGLEGLTWGLISDRIKVRYLPSGYILDSGAPIGVLKDGVNRDELFFIIGWLLTPLSTEILKNVLNHTKNIQSKDIERIPYPFWVNDDTKIEVINLVKEMVDSKMSGNNIIIDYKKILTDFFQYK